MSARLSDNASAMLRAIARPSLVLVPLPSSSIIARLFSSIFLQLRVSKTENERKSLE